MIGMTLGNYQIIEELGRGAMGIVYKAHQVSLNRLVALKVLHPGLSSDDQLIKRFEREAESMARLNHPYIVHIYDVGQEGDYHFFAAEFVKGQTLGSLLRSRGALDLVEALPIVKQVAAALDYAHQMGVIHRDIKPGNIMLSETKNAKVTDFGIATILDKAQITQENAVVGTPSTISPEQASGKRVNEATDQYALACVMVEMITGNPPFHGGSPASILFRHVSEDPEPVSRSVRSLPRAFDAVILKALAKSPQSRYPSCTAFCEAMEKASSERPEPAQTAPKGQPRRSVTTDLSPDPLPRAETAPSPQAAPRVFALHERKTGPVRTAPAPSQQRPYRPKRKGSLGSKTLIGIVLLLAAGGGVCLTRYRSQVEGLWGRLPWVARQGEEKNRLLKEAQSLLENKEYESAIKRAEEAQNAGADEAKASRIIEMATAKFERARNLGKEGITLYTAGKVVEAQSKLKQALDIDPKNDMAASYLKRVRQALGELDLAVAPEKPGESTAEWIRRAQSLEAGEEYAEASALYVQASRSATGRESGELEEKANDLQEVADLLSKGDACLRANKTDEARRSFEAVTKRIDSRVARLGTVRCLESDQQFEQAVWKYGELEQEGGGVADLASDAIDRIRKERGSDLLAQWLTEAEDSAKGGKYDECNRHLKLAMRMAAGEEDRSRVAGLMAKAESEWKAEGQK